MSTECSFIRRDGGAEQIDMTARRPSRARRALAAGAVGTKVSGINHRGEMVGYYDTDTSRGFALRDGRFTTIDPPGSLASLPSGIDNRGRVVGGYLDANGVNGRGFLWEDGRYTTIVAPGERTDTVAIDMNDRGDIVIPADGTLYRQSEIACGRPTVPSSPRPRLPPRPWTRSRETRSASRCPDRRITNSATRTACIFRSRVVGTALAWGASPFRRRRNLP